MNRALLFLLNFVYYPMDWLYRFVFWQIAWLYKFLEMIQAQEAQ